MSGEACEKFIVDDRGEEQEGDSVDDDDDDVDDDDVGGHQADEKRLMKIAIRNVNKAVTIAVELAYFKIDTVPLTLRHRAYSI